MTKPRKLNCAAHAAIVKLVDLGGRGLTSQILSILPAEFFSIRRFNKSVVDPLELANYARFAGDYFSVTTLGREYVSAHEKSHAPVPKSKAQIAGPRTPPPFKPLKQIQLPPLRDGALDYLDIPSRMGESRKFPNRDIT